MKIFSGASHPFRVHITPQTLTTASTPVKAETPQTSRRHAPAGNSVQASSGAQPANPTFTPSFVRLPPATPALPDLPLDPISLHATDPLPAAVNPVTQVTSAPDSPVIPAASSQTALISGTGSPSISLDLSA